MRTNKFWSILMMLCVVFSTSLSSCSKDNDAGDDLEDSDEVPDSEGWSNWSDFARYNGTALKW